MSIIRSTPKLLCYLFPDLRYQMLCAAQNYNPALSSQPSKIMLLNLFPVRFHSNKLLGNKAIYGCLTAPLAASSKITFHYIQVTLRIIVAYDAKYEKVVHLILCLILYLKSACEPNTQILPINNKSWPAFVHTIYIWIDALLIL